MVFRAHQRQFHLVLHVLDVEGAAFAHALGQRGDDIAGQFLDDLMDAPRRGRRIALDGDERLGERHRNLGGVERGHAPVALDEAVARLGSLGMAR